MKLYTIGFTQKTAEEFFGLLAGAGVRRLVDIRLKPHGQLAGFANSRDLPYFLSRLNGCDYVHLPELAPNASILSDYRKDHDWQRFHSRFGGLMDERGVPGNLDRASFEAAPSCLLCSEAEPEHCHRRIVAERIAGAWPGVEVIDLE